MNIRVRLSEIPELPAGHQTERQSLLLSVETSLEDEIKLSLDATEVEFDVPNGKACSLIRRRFQSKDAVQHQIDSGAFAFRPNAEVEFPMGVQTAFGVLSLVSRPPSRGTIQVTTGNVTTRPTATRPTTTQPTTTENVTTQPTTLSAPVSKPPLTARNSPPSGVSEE